MLNFNTKSNNQYINFGSKNKPISPFKINTTQGELVTKEMKTNEIYTDEELHSMSKFFVDNLIDGSTHPGWKKYLKPNNNYKYENRINEFVNFLKFLFKEDNPNTTVLIAKNNNNEIKAGIVAFRFYHIKKIEDPKTLYVYSVAVDKSYRNNGIASIMMKKVLSAAKGFFTDTILMAYNKAIPLYSKLGFSKPDVTDPKIKPILDIFTSESTSMPRYAKLMSKVIDKKEIRCWERMFNKL